MVNKSKPKTKSKSLVGDRLIISVKEARKLLGQDFKDLGDEQIGDIVTKLDLLAQGFIAEKVSI